MNTLEFRKVSDELDMSRLRKFMLDQPQLYPDHGDWIDWKCLPRIESGIAEGWIAVQDGQIVGDAVYQQVEEQGVIELKNFRIDPGFRQRSTGRHLLALASLEAPSFMNDFENQDEKPVIMRTDVTGINFSAMEFFIRSGFNIKNVMRGMYRDGQDEYILERPIRL